MLYFCNRFREDDNHKRNKLFGVWRSWLAHLHGVQGVESSSLFTPTIKKKGLSFLSPFLLYTVVWGSGNDIM